MDEQGVENTLAGDVRVGTTKVSASCAIKRDHAHPMNLSGGQETFIPSRLLAGLIPQALLDTHRFWQVRAVFSTVIALA